MFNTKNYIIKLNPTSVPHFHINNDPITLDQIHDCIIHNKKLIVASSVLEKVHNNRVFLEHKLKSQEEPIYGINTGFGSLCNIKINDTDVNALQENLVLSHACGMGDKIDFTVTKAIFLLKIINLCQGNSGVQKELIMKMIDIYNANVMPVIYDQGSLGASGDLSPLAHLSLVLIGKGKAYYNGDEWNSSELLQMLKIQPIQLKAKEGLALLNGTQFSTAFATMITVEANRLLKLANMISAISIEAYLADIIPFNARIHEVRPYPGQQSVAKHIYDLLQHSEFRKLEKSNVQDPYSFRCIPQVHGATLQTILHAEEIISVEINATTDNPLVFDADDMVISGGNFHAQPIAFVLDYLAIGLSELASISERRIYQLINGDRGLPPFLTPTAGLHSGYMIAQYTAASIVSQNKQYATPASVDSIISSKGQEDHVSMAANAATKTYKILQNVKSVLAIELLVSAQALEFRRPLKTHPKLESLVAELREKVPFRTVDVIMHDDMMASRAILEKNLHRLDLL